MASILIEHAKPGDIDQINALIESRIVHSRDLNASQSLSIRTGLFDHSPPTPEKCALRLQSNYYFIARDLSQKRVVGMIDAYDSTLIPTYFPKDDFLKSIRAEFEQHGRFLYLNTIAVARDREREGIGGKLLDTLVSQTPFEFKFTLGVIVHKPIKNEASAALVKNAGFSLFKMANAYNCDFGVYVKMRSSD